ncbi:FAD-dependent thymidylate synthase [Anaeromicrobium sediminis]|uniref:Flavin-dependent thymidylate synthase n=1 Tax=Anaeromicrobium sediminis TaxID=1478221 RepID=A0A267MD99_9FIRM|nr:FAD-dependent thymidylate synthase [Anaeromicrobium sediminis]PAB57561.1 thymidylate synthase (FAD) [Anaeromicrobium sediminis]
MNVKLIQYTNEPEKVVATAAKLCYSPSGVDEIQKGLDDEKIEKFISMLMGLGHESPIEHINFTFAAEGISRVLTHQLVRHRIASYSQQSQRYVKLDQFEYIIPPSIKGIKEAEDKFIKAMEEDQKTYDELVGILQKKHMDKFLKDGISEKKAKSMAEKKAIEDSRYVFPNACETKIVFTMNARTLMNFFHHRCCERAQWEIREMATRMLMEVRKAAPNIFKYAGPNCLKGTCPEGAMTCGNIKAVIEKFKNI